MREIAERRRVQDALRTSEERYRGVFQSATDALLVVDQEGRIVGANPAAHRMHRYAAGQLAGVSVPELVTESARPLYRQIKGNLDQGRVVRLDAVHRRSDGSEFDVEVKASRFRRGQNERVLVIVTDVGARQQTISRLAKAKPECPYVTPEALAKVVEDKTDTKVVLGTHDYK